MKSTKVIDNLQDVIDSRDVIERIEELEGDVEAELASDDDIAELETLKVLAEEAEGYAEDWKHGEALIRDSYFTEYAQQLAEDMGAVSENQNWPNTCIDWEEAARQLQQDYTEVDFDGVAYWIR
jgi:hypothetical protein